MTLNKIVEKIKDATITANTEVEMGNPGTYKSRVGQKRQAEEQLIELREQYVEQLLETSAFILVSGEDRNTFAEVATYKDFSCFSGDPEALFNDLAARVPETLYLNRPSCSDAFDVLSRHLEDLAIDLNVFSIPQLIFRNEYSQSMHNLQEFTALVKRAICDQIGSELVGIYTIRKMLDQAIENGHPGPITPIIFASNDEVFIADLAENLQRLHGRVFQISAGKIKGKKTPGTLHLKQVTTETVTDALSKIRGAL